MRTRGTCLVPIVLACGLAPALAACGASAVADDEPAADARVDGPTSDADDVDFSRVYAHSGQILYRLDTGTLQPVEIGPFANLGTQSMTDIAVDKNDRMLGVTLDKIYEVDINTGAATLLSSLEVGAPNLTSLSFVPVDLGNPDSAERLVAATDQGTVLEINPTTGATTMLGSYGSAAGGLIRSSGDIVAVSGFGILATVDVGTTEPDYLAQINPTTWAATPLGVGTGYDKIFGLGFWRGKVYGFVDNGAGNGGAIIEINPNTGAGAPVNTGAIRWFGAGVTTDAPIIL